MTAPATTSSNSNRSTYTANTAATGTSGSTTTTKATMAETAATATTTPTKTSKFGFAKSKSKASSFRGSSSNDNSSKKKKWGFKLPKLSNLSLASHDNKKYPKPKIVKAAIPVLEEELSVLTHDAPFLAQAAASPQIVRLDRKEVCVGELLGQGQFATVYNVTALELLPSQQLDSAFSKEDQSKRERFVQEFTVCHQSQASASSHDNHHTNNNHTEEQKCHHRYAVKHVKRDLLVSPAARRRRRRNHKHSLGVMTTTTSANVAVDTGDSDNLPADQQFQLAAADLIIEALYLSRLQHPHIISIRGMAAAGGSAAFSNGRYDSFFLVLDRLSETLYQRIKTWRRTLGDPREEQLATKTYYAYQMALALDYLHQHRIIFRDLKPSNIGFHENARDGERLQIFDFGLCRELPQSSSQNKDKEENEVYFMTAAGTHRYMAVEILKGDKYNAKADVYSFAMVYYELLAQQAPFSNLSEEDHNMLVCVRKHRPHHFFGCVVPQSIQKLLGDAWEHEIPDRLTMAQVVLRLEDILTQTFHQRLREGLGGVKILDKECGGGAGAAAGQEEKAPVTTGLVPAAGA